MTATTSAGFFAASTSLPHPAMMLPFAILLLALAVMPFAAANWWHHHYPKVSVGLGAIILCYYLFVLQNGLRVLHVAHEYAGFIALIGSLFIVAGGIQITVKGEAKPWVNCLFLLSGAVLANIIGTTGASMLLIRPWIRMNYYRITGFHVTFFIFIVSNVGGCLTPIGDPPLFIGYLKGVPFWWSAQWCWGPWLVVVGALLLVFYILDQGNFMQAPLSIREKETESESWSFRGLQNVAWLAVILAAVFVQKPAGAREVLMIAAAVASYLTTPRGIYEANKFNFAPIREVAWIFAGIFATMIPALDYIEGHAMELGINSTTKLYWLTGGLSACLDNAPTYLTFLAAAMGGHQLALNDPAQVQQFAAANGLELLAISLGAVFFGGVTYIGNGPNFMVKTVCEHAKVRTPNFLAYILYFAIPFVLPVFLLVWLLFLSPWRIR